MFPITLRPHPTSPSPPKVPEARLGLPARKSQLFLTPDQKKLINSDIYES